MAGADAIATEFAERQRVLVSWAEGEAFAGRVVGIRTEISARSRRVVQSSVQVLSEGEGRR